MFWRLGTRPGAVRLEAVSGPEAFNPLDRRNLATSVANALLASDVGPLPPLKAFNGAGVYAIYYLGDHPFYRPISGQDVPIYVGKAIPMGSRKGGFGLDTPAGQVLYGRFREHAESIHQTKTLRLADFGCRYLVTDDIWIPLAESLLIREYRPVWNSPLVGFGNHDPGSGRYQQQQSPWDVMHPGRPWVERCAPCKKTPAEIEAGVKAHLKAVGKKPERKERGSSSR